MTGAIATIKHVIKYTPKSVVNHSESVITAAFDLGRPGLLHRTHHTDVHCTPFSAIHNKSSAPSKHTASSFPDKIQMAPPHPIQSPSEPRTHTRSWPRRVFGLSTAPLPEVIRYYAVKRKRSGPGGNVIDFHEEIPFTNLADAEWHNAMFMARVAWDNDTINSIHCHTTLNSQTCTVAADPFGTAEWVFWVEARSENFSLM